MKFFNCPNCDSRFPSRPVECPSCGETISPSEWKEVECEPPAKPDNPIILELHGDTGHPFVFRKQPFQMGVGRPSIVNVSTESKCCEREQFVLLWEGTRCFISPPATPTRNPTFVDGNKLLKKVELRQGSTIDLRGTSGRIAVPLTALYS